MILAHAANPDGPNFRKGQVRRLKLLLLGRTTGQRESQKEKVASVHLAGPPES